MRQTPIRFLTILALAFAAVGFGAMAWVFIAALGPIRPAAASYAPATITASRP
ncbi:MAG: hypothetical protein ACP5M1_11330 [Acidiphilium sp.]|jgi:hypothetical protein